MLMACPQLEQEVCAEQGWGEAGSQTESASAESPLKLPAHRRGLWLTGTQLGPLSSPHSSPGPASSHGFLHHHKYP